MGQFNDKVFYKIFDNKKRTKKEFISQFAKYIPYKKITQNLFLDEKIKKDIDLIAKTIDKKTIQKSQKSLKNTTSQAV